jgi:probable F420-dependent oxidoreductase
MHIGALIFPTDLSIRPALLARELEDRGFESLWVTEHTHIPTSRRTPAPTGTPELGDEYKRSPDPYIVLAAAASVTERIELGTGIGLPLQHDPITMAKELATLDLVSGGRFVFGIGFGWNHEEMENHGIDVRRRRARCREHMLAMQALWADDVAEFHGEFVDFEPSWQWPKPVQRPRIRTLIGGAPGPKMFAHIAEYADGWIPIGGSGLAASLTELRELVAAQGRDPDALHIVPFGTLPSEGKLDHYASIGVTEVVLRLPSAGADAVLPVLDEYTRFLARTDA